MRFSRSLGALFAPLVLLGACGPTGRPTAEDAYSKLHGDSGINGGTYEDIIASVKAVADKYPQLTQMIEYGTSNEGRKLTLIKIQDKSVQVAGKRPAILISEGIHGNEYLNITDRLPREFLDGASNHSGFKQLLAKGGIIYMVPILNPDGFTATQRENANGQDLNRNFTIKAAGNRGFSEPETKGITDLIAKEAQAYNLSLEASMEYHCCIGGLIHPWNYDVNRELEGDFATRKNEVVSIFQPIFPNYLIGNVRVVVNYPDGAVGGSDDYYLETYGRRAFSFEGQEGSEFRNLSKHVDLWDGIFSLAAKTFPDGTNNGPQTPQPTQPAPSANDLYLAINGEPTAGSVQLLGATPLSFDGMIVCLGPVDQCGIGSATPRIQMSATSTVGTSRIYQAQQLVTVNTAAPTVVTMIALHGTQQDSSSLLRSAKIVKK